MLSPLSTRVLCAIFGVPVCICDDSTFYADLCGLLPISNPQNLKKRVTMQRCIVSLCGIKRVNVNVYWRKRIIHVNDRKEERSAKKQQQQK